MSNHYERLMASAKKRVAAMDATDGSSVAVGPLESGLRTVMLALQAAIQSRDWNIVADAQVMLQQLHTKYRPADNRNDPPFLQTK